MTEQSMLHEWIDASRRRHTSEWCSFAHRGLSDAVVFHLGLFSEVPPGHPSQWAVLRPPYPVTVLEYMFPDDDVRSRGLLVCVERNDAEGFYVIPAEKMRGGEWVTGHPVSGCRTAHGELDFDTDAVGEIRERVLTRWALAATFFNLLKCVNVEVVDHPAPAALNKKRVAAGKLPIYSFRSLVLKIPNTRKAAVDQGGTHASPRVHLRRGHIRQLGDGRAIWVQSCVVGTKQGMIQKEYRLQVTGGEA